MLKLSRTLNIIILSGLVLLTACGGSSSDSEANVGSDTDSNSDANLEANKDSNTEANGSNSSHSECVMTSSEQEMLDQVNQARSNRRSCGNDLMPAVATLSWNCQLRDAAFKHSTDMVENNFFDHTGSDGLSAGHRATASGYIWRSVGENLAVGQTSITQAVTGLLNSPGHCRNIMSAGFTEFGSALVLRSQVNTEADYSHYWTQVFGRPR